MQDQHLMSNVVVVMTYCFDFVMCKNKQTKILHIKISSEIENVAQNSPLILFVFVFRDDHGFSPLHWCAKEGHYKLVEMLLQRGARVNATNMGDDIPLHLAAAHGHFDIVQIVS